MTQTLNYLEFHNDLAKKMVQEVGRKYLLDEYGWPAWMSDDNCRRKFQDAIKFSHMVSDYFYSLGMTNFKDGARAYYEAMRDDTGKKDWKWSRDM